MHIYIYIYIYILHSFIQDMSSCNERTNSLSSEKSCTIREFQDLNYIVDYDQMKNCPNCRDMRRAFCGLMFITLSPASAASIKGVLSWWLRKLR